LHLQSVPSRVGSYHLLRIDNPIEFLRADGAEVERGLLEREVVIQSVMRDLRIRSYSVGATSCGRMFHGAIRFRIPSLTISV
jgi:hypothetical protein